MALTRRTLFGAAALLFVLAGAAQARPEKKSPEETMLGQLINNVRYAQDKTALTYLDGDQQARFLLGAAYDKGTPAQREEFIRLFHQVFAGVAFPKMRDNFEHLTSITYEPAQQKDGKTFVASVIHVQAGPKEQEISVRYELSATAGKKPQVVDVTVKGDNSMLTNIRDDQIQPILSEGGWDKLLDLLRAKAKEVPVPADKPLTPAK